MGRLDNWYFAERDGVDAANIVKVTDDGLSDFEIFHVAYVVCALKLSGICAQDTYLLSQAGICGLLT